MDGTRSKGEGIFSKVKGAMDKFKLPNEKLVGMTTDGAPTLTGKHGEFVTLMKNASAHEIITLHCVIHQEQLCAKTMEMNNAMEKVVTQPPTIEGSPSGSGCLI